MIMKISPIALSNHSPLKLRDVGPLRCIFPAGGTPHKHHPQIVQRRSHSPAFGQSHAAEKPDRP